MVEQGTIRRLLETIEERLLRLTALSSTPLGVYVTDTAIQDRTERNFEVVIQACIDLGLHVLADVPAPVPETNRAVFTALEQKAIVDADLARRLETMAGFRNILAHGYTVLLPEKVHAALAHLDDIRAYVAQVVDYLCRQGDLPC